MLQTFAYPVIPSRVGQLTIFSSFLRLPSSVALLPLSPSTVILTSRLPTMHPSALFTSSSSIPPPIIVASSIAELLASSSPVILSVSSLDLLSFSAPLFFSAKPTS